MSQPRAAHRSRRTALRILSLVAVIAITILIFVYRDQAETLAAYGYPGIFVLSILANATLIMPAPGVAITFTMGAVFHPFLVGLAAGTGSAIGELTGYLAGFSGQVVVERTPWYERLEDWTERYGPWTILALAFIPNPLFDLAGVAAGALRMPLARFLFFAWVGKTAKMLAFAYAGAYSLNWMIELFGMG